MVNPWLEIPACDYEKHMAQVGQLQVLNELIGYVLKKHQPAIFGLPGCSTGNGLEHVDNRITQRVIAMDVNPEYLKIAGSRYQQKIPGLELLQADIQNYNWCSESVDLIFTGLLLEYVDPAIVLLKMVKALNHGGVLALAIQKNYGAAFVSSSPYKSLKALSGVSHAVDKQLIHETLTSNGLQQLEEDEIPVSSEKSLIFLSFLRK